MKNKKITMVALLMVMTFIFTGCSTLRDACHGLEVIQGKENTGDPSGFDALREESEQLKKEQEEREQRAEEYKKELAEEGAAPGGVIVSENDYDAKWRNTPEEAKRIAEKMRDKWFPASKTMLDATYAKEATVDSYFEQCKITLHAAPYIYEFPYCMDAKEAVMDFQNNKDFIANTMSEEDAENLARELGKIIDSYYYEKSDTRYAQTYWQSDNSLVYQSVDGIRIRYLVCLRVKKSNKPEEQQYMNRWLTSIIEVVVPAADSEQGEQNRVIELADWDLLEADQIFLDYIDRVE